MTTIEERLEYLDTLINMIADAEEDIGTYVDDNDDYCKEASDAAYFMLTQIGCALSTILDIRETMLR